MILGKINAEVLDSLRKRGLSDETIGALSPEEAFTEYCEWHGLIRWSGTLVTALDSLRAASAGERAQSEPGPAVSVSRDEEILELNVREKGKTPRRLSNKLNPFSSGDADTLVQMGANLLPKVESDGMDEQSGPDYTVQIEVSVTANTPQEAAQYALDDLRDPSIERWNMRVVCDRTGAVVDVPESDAEKVGDRPSSRG